MKIPTYNEAKGRHTSHAMIYGIVSVNGRRAFTENHKRSKKKTKSASKRKERSSESVKDLPTIIGKFPRGYVLERAIILSVDNDAYVAICEGFDGQSFIKAYTKSNETSSDYYRQSKIVHDRREELESLVRAMFVGGVNIGLSSWNRLYAAACEKMKPYTARGNVRVSQVAMMVLSKSETVKRNKQKLRERLEAKQSESSAENQTVTDSRPVT